MAAKKYAVTGDQYIGIDKKIADIKRQLRQDGGSPIDPVYLNWALQQLGEGRRLVLADVTSNIVVVPDLSAVELTALTKRDLNLTYLDTDYAKWDYYRDLDGNPIHGRCLKFEALVWKPELDPNSIISSEQARAYLRERGFYGHVGAFTQWRGQNPDLMGYHASIPEDAACWRRADGHLCAPYSYFDGGYRELGQDWVGSDWDDDWSFVGFREVS